MSELSGTVGAVSEKIAGFLSNKPIWALWIIHTVVAAGLFGVFYAVIYLLALKWWGAAIAIVALGVIWGSVVYAKKESLKRPE